MLLDVSSLMASGKAIPVQRLEPSSRKTRSQDSLPEQPPPTSHPTTRKRPRPDSKITNSRPKRPRQETGPLQQVSSPFIDTSSETTVAEEPHNTGQQLSAANVDTEPTPLDEPAGQTQIEAYPHTQQPHVPESQDESEAAPFSTPHIRRSQRRAWQAEDSPDETCTQGPGAQAQKPSETDQQVSDVPKATKNTILAEDLNTGTRNQILSILETTSEQILSLFSEISPSDWLVFYESPDLSSMRTSWTILQSIFSHSRSFIDLGALMIDASPPNDERADPKAGSESLRLINMTTAFSILMKNSPQHHELKIVNDKFLDLFGEGHGHLLDWQVKIGLDVRQETWRTGVRENFFSKADGLTMLFSNDPSTSYGSEFQRRLQERRTRLEQNSERALPQQVFFGPEYGKELASVAIQCIHTLRSSREASQPPAPPPATEEKAEYIGDSREPSESFESLAAAAHHALTAQDMKPVPNETTTSQLATPVPEEAGKLPPHSVVSNASSETLRDGQWSTREQYERAKLAAAEKAAARNKGVPIQPSQRRPWSREEERALLTGLDEVQGPHWSQILAMYGAGGSISEVLKDRNQVQLKDKARNLKLFFLKSALEVPHYLKNVTGELKTRAPQAARNEMGITEDIYGNETSSSRPNVFLSAGPRFHSRSPDEKGASKEQVNSQENGPRSHEDQENLSNAIQLALEAILEKNGPQAEADGISDDAKPDDAGGATLARTLLQPQADVEQTPTS